ERRLTQFVERSCRRDEVVWARDVELLDRRRLIVEQPEELDLRGSQVHLGGLNVGFVVHALELQAVEIELCDVAGLESRAAKREHLVVARKVVRRERTERFRLKDLHERRSQREDQRALEIGLPRGRDRRRILRAVAPQLALLLTLVKIRDRGR